MPPRIHVRSNLPPLVVTCAIFTKNSVGEHVVVASRAACLTRSTRLTSSRETTRHPDRGDARDAAPQSPALHLRPGQRSQVPHRHRSRTACTSLQLTDIHIPNSELTLLCDTSGVRPRPIVPAVLKQKIFDQIHNLGHPGIRATKKLIGDRFVWHGMARDITSMVRSCKACATSKIHRHNRAVLNQFPQPTARLQHVHVDIVGPLPASNGYRYLLTAIDRYTRWSTATPLTCITAA